MTIEYKDSKRIVVLSTDVADTATYETETFATGWEQNTTGTTNIAVANSRVEYDVTDSGTSQSTLVYDLGTANISETSWTLRGKSVINNYSSTSGSSCHFFCGLSNGSKTVAFDGSQNSISFAIGVGTSDAKYYLGSSVNGAMYAMTNQTSGDITHLPTAETVWFEIKRNNATSATITLYTDSTYTTSPAGYSRTLTLSSAPTGLRYLVFKSRDRSIASQSLDGYVDDLEFYNGTTSSKPTNVQDNTILVEKDLGRRYWATLAPTFEDDFSSDDWTESGDQNFVSGGVLNWDFARDGSHHKSTYDLGAGNVSDTSWVLRFKMTIDNLSSGGSNAVGFIGIADTDNSVAASSNSTGLWVHFARSGSHAMRSATAGVMNTGGLGEIHTFASDMFATQGETRYVEFIKLTATTAKITFYEDDTYTTVDETSGSQTINTTTGLRYIFACTYPTGSSTAGSFDGTIDDVEFYNGVTTATGTATWTRNDSSMYKSTALTNAMTVGGISSAWVAITSVNNWNGSAWSAGTAISPSQGLTMYRGNTDSGINCGGFSGTAIGTGLNKCQTWDGSSWVTKTSMNNRRAVGFGLGGTEDSAFATGGQDGSGGTQYLTAEKYDGSANTWATTPPPNSTYGGQGSMGAGDPEDYVNSGNQNSGGTASSGVMETWNGTTWTTLPSSSNFTGGTPYNYGSCCGVGNDSYMQGINSDTTGTAKIYKFNGSTWTDSGSATTAPKYVGMGGDSSSAIICGAWSNGTSSSYYDGTTWTTTTALQTGRAGNGTGATT